MTEEKETYLETSNNNSQNIFGIQENSKYSHFYEVFDENNKNEKKEEEKKRKEKIEHQKNEIIICPKCHFFPIISFNNNNKINRTCKCPKKKENNYNIHNFIQNYVKNINEIEYKKCQAHGQELTSFCPECSIDLCSECINTKQHYHHSIKNYSLDQNKINEIKKCIDEYEKKGEEEQSKNDDVDACIKIFKKRTGRKY